MNEDDFEKQQEKINQQNDNDFSFTHTVAQETIKNIKLIGPHLMAQLLLKNNEELARTLAWAIDCGLQDRKFREMFDEECPYE